MAPQASMLACAGLREHKSTKAGDQLPTDACFARHAGVAPIPASSGNTNRYRLHRGGDRQLNRAIHILAFSRARTDPATQAYLKRKHAEGKSKLEAIRCLKRHGGRHIWRVLYTATPPNTPARVTNALAVGAPAVMPCTS